MMSAMQETLMKSNMRPSMAITRLDVQPFCVASLNPSLDRGGPLAAKATQPKMHHHVASA
jgi:hypothetical protein